MEGLQGTRGVHTLCPATGGFLGINGEYQGANKPTYSTDTAHAWTQPDKSRLGSHRQAAQEWVPAQLLISCRNGK